MAPSLDLDSRMCLQRESQEKACLGENAEFAPLKIGEFTGFVRRNQWSDEIESLLANPQGMLAEAVIVKDSRVATVGTLTVMGKGVFVKRYKYRGPVYALKNLFRSSRAKRVWLAGNTCYSRGIDVALPLAYLERRRFRVLREGYLLTAAVEGDELSQLLGRQHGNIRRKRWLIRQLARQLRMMHDRGIGHRDLKGENVIAQGLDEGRYRFVIVDFDGVALRRVSRRMRVKNLARLARAVAAKTRLTATDRLRFVKTYLGVHESSQWRKMYRDLLRCLGRFRFVDARGLVAIILWEWF